MSRLIGIYGGTFDPIHLGHTNAAAEVQRKLGLDEVRMLLSAQPPHKNSPVLSALDRYHLLLLALKGSLALHADDTEMQRPGPSYMVDTLLGIRGSMPEARLILILGMEAFNGLMSWYRWEDLLKLAHIVITDRAGFDNNMAPILKDYAAPFLTDDKSQLEAATHGKIYHLAVQPVDISATQIRRLIKDNKPVKQWLSDDCLEEIKRRRFYASTN